MFVMNDLIGNIQNAELGLYTSIISWRVSIHEAISNDMKNHRRQV